MPEFVKFLLWTGAVGAAIYYLVEEVRPHNAKKPLHSQELLDASVANQLSQDPNPDPKNLRIIALSQLAGESRDIPGNAVQFFNRCDHPDLMSRFIVEAIGHPDPSIRRNAAEVAGLMRIEAARPALERRVQDPRRDVQRAAVHALKAVGDERSYFALVLALKGPAWETRLEAAEALGLHGGQKALRHLWTALLDPEPLVADMAAQSLLKLANPGAIPFFESKLKDKDPLRADLARRAIEAARAAQTASPTR